MGGFDIEPYKAEHKISVTLGTVYAYNNGVSNTYYQCFLSNGYTDNYIVNIDKLILDGMLSVTINNENSIVNINTLYQKSLSDMITGIVFTCAGLINIKDFELDINNCENMTRLFYSEKLNGHINNLTIINNGASKPTFISNINTIKLDIDYLNYIGYIENSNTNQTKIHINTISNKEQIIESTTDNNNEIRPFSNNISVTNEVDNVSYNDIAQYDNYSFTIFNNNETTNCNIYLNLCRFLKDNTKISTVTIEPKQVCKITYDIKTNVYVVNYVI